MKEKSVIAVFDFDGTITYRDTFVAFLWHTTPMYSFLWNFFVLMPKVFLFCFRYYNRQQLKEHFISQFFGGMPEDTLGKWGSNFAQGALERLIRPEALQRIHWHQKQGHQCLLVSASLDIYLVPWGKRHSFDQVVCSRVEVDGSGRITGKLFGVNCRGAEKVRRIEEILGPLHKYFLYVYGDSSGDRELLACADRGFYQEMPLHEI